MQTITFDGSKIFSISREKSGQVNISICENEVGLKVGQVREVLVDEGLKANCLARLELPNEITYINLCRALLSYADRHELMKIIGNPISWAGYAVKERKRRKEWKKRN